MFFVSTSSIFSGEMAKINVSFSGFTGVLKLETNKTIDNTKIAELEKERDDLISLRGENYSEESNLVKAAFGEKKDYHEDTNLQKKVAHDKLERVIEEKRKINEIEDEFKSLEINEKTLAIFLRNPSNIRAKMDYLTEVTENLMSKYGDNPRLNQMINDKYNEKQKLLEQELSSRVPTNTKKKKKKKKNKPPSGQPNPPSGKPSPRNRDISDSARKRLEIIEEQNRRQNKAARNAFLKTNT